MGQAVSRMQQPNLLQHAHPPTLQQNYQYNQKPSQYHPSQYPMNQANSNGVSNDLIGMSSMPPPMHGSAYQHSHYPQQQTQPTQSHGRLDPDNIPNPVRFIFVFKF